MMINLTEEQCNQVLKALEESYEHIGHTIEEYMSKYGYGSDEEAFVEEVLSYVSYDEGDTAYIICKRYVQVEQAIFMLREVIYK